MQPEPVLDVAFPKEILLHQLPDGLRAKFSTQRNDADGAIERGTPAMCRGGLPAPACQMSRASRNSVHIACRNYSVRYIFCNS